MAGMDASMMTSEGTCRLVMPLSLLTMAKSGRDSSVSEMVASIAARSSGDMSGNLATKSPNPLLKSTPAASKALPWRSTTGLKKARTAAPNKIGSDTFIMVAFMCNENRAPSLLTRSISAVRNDSKWRMDKAAQSMISSAWRARPRFNTVRFPEASTCTMSTVVGPTTVTLFSDP